MPKFKLNDIIINTNLTEVLNPTNPTHKDENAIVHRIVIFCE